MSESVLMSERVLNSVVNVFGNKKETSTTEVSSKL